MSPIIGVIDSAKTGRLTTGDYESISTVTVGPAGQSTIVFNSIPQTYAHLQLRCLLKDSRVSSTNSGSSMRFNGDTGSNYSEWDMFGDSSSMLQSGSTTTSSLPMFNYPASNSNSSTFGMGILDILYYSNTNVYKNIRSFGGHSQNTVADGFITFYAGTWKNNSAVTSITISPLTAPFVQYSTVALYGIKG